MSVQYIVKPGGKFERVKLSKCHGKTIGTVLRHGRPIARFVPSPSQIAKIKKRKGTINVTSKAMSRVSIYCSSAGW